MRTQRAWKRVCSPMSDFEGLQITNKFDKLFLKQVLSLHQETVLNPQYLNRSRLTRLRVGNRLSSAFLQVGKELHTFT